jgi:hypothetical protein
MKMSRCQGYFTPVPRRCQRVEKVDVGPVGGPKEARNEANTLQERRFQLLNQVQKGAKGFFNSLVWSRNYIYENLHKL